jgi:hypothetical protein
MRIGQHSAISGAVPRVLARGLVFQSFCVPCRLFFPESWVHEAQQGGRHTYSVSSCQVTPLQSHQSSSSLEAEEVVQDYSMPHTPPLPADTSYDASVSNTLKVGGGHNAVAWFPLVSPSFP